MNHIHPSIHQTIHNNMGQAHLILIMKGKDERVGDTHSMRVTELPTIIPRERESTRPYLAGAGRWGTQLKASWWWAG